MVSQKKYEEADTVLQKAARMNGVALPDQWWQLLDEEMVEMVSKGLDFEKKWS